MGKDKSKKIIIRKQKCDPTSDSSITQTIICSRTPSDMSDTSCSSSNKSDPRVYLIEASGKTSSSSSCSSSSSSKDCRVVYAPKSSCESNCGNGCRGSTFYCFCGVVRPVRNFALVEGKSCGELEIKVSINNRSVTIMWPSFSGTIDSSGTPYLTMCQSFRGLPSYPIFGSFAIETKGGTYISVIEILPNNTNTIRWYLSPSMKGSNVSQGDAFTIFGGALTYIMSNDCC